LSQETCHLGFFTGLINLNCSNFNLKMHWL